MVQVLEPFEVGDGDTTSVQIQVRNDQNFLVEEDLLGLGCHWAVRAFADDFRLDSVGVVGGDDLW